jgi:cell volume regulation protein A
MIIGNSKIANRKEVATFFDGLTWLFQIVMFILLGLLVNPKEMLGVAPVALLIGAFMILVGRPLSVLISLLPFRWLTGRSRLYISWVGLRGAVPIIFATYPVVAGIEGSNQIFNIVFFITLLSLILQGTTLPFFARKLGLSAPMEKTGNDFGVELPDEIDTDLTDLTITPDMLADGDTLKEIALPDGALVMIVKRGTEFLVPNGSLHLQAGDKLLLISER